MRISDWSSDVCSSDLGSVHVFVIGDGHDFAACDVQGCFGFLLEFLDLEDHLNADDAVEVASKPIEFLLDVVTQGIGYFQLNTTVVDLHTAISFALYEEQVGGPAAGPVRTGADHNRRLRSVDV